MIAVLAAAVLTCAGALIIGQGVCWIGGARTWTFLAAPVGLAAMMLLSLAAIHVPGHTDTLVAVFVILGLAGVALLIRVAELRPRAWHLLAVAPVGFMVLLPFLASARAGTLGVSFDNDMETHLRWAEVILSPSLAAVSGLDPSYPIGPHALCAVLARGLGTSVDHAFAGETMAIPLLIAWTALIALRRVGWLGKTWVATIVGMPFLVAAYYAQGSFKELMQALFVLGFALGLEEMYSGERVGRLRWVPLGVIVGGSLSAYSVTGLPWFLAILLLWFPMYGVRRAARSRPRKLLIEARAAVWPIAIGLGVLVILLVPQLPRLVKFYEGNVGVGAGTGIPTSSLGNLVGPIEFWKVFGLWDNADYRLPAINAFHVGMLSAFGLAAAIIGLLWWMRKNGWIVPLAAGVALLIWAYSDSDQSPYVAAKALVILAPLVMLLATRWLVELGPRESWLSSSGALRVVLAALLGWAVIGSSVKVLESAYVGPTDHLADLRSIEPMLGRSKTLFLGWDDFIGWELDGTPVEEPYLGYLHYPLRPQKAWQPGEPFDFDDITPEILDRYRFVVGPRDPAGSEPPSNMKLVRSTRYYEVWERVGPTPARQILQEGQEPGAVLNCATAAGRALARKQGVAAIRSPNVVVAVPPAAPGQTLQVKMSLGVGKWWLTAPYTSPHPIAVSAPGFHTVVPANLDRPGNRWPVGELTVTNPGPTVVSMTIEKPALAGPVPTYMNMLVASRAAPDRLLPLSQACGRYIDWYRLS